MVAPRELIEISAAVDEPFSKRRAAPPRSSIMAPGFRPGWRHGVSDNSYSFSLHATESAPDGNDKYLSSASISRFRNLFSRNRPRLVVFRRNIGTRADGSQHHGFRLNNARFPAKPAADAYIFVDDWPLAVEAKRARHRAASFAGATFRASIGQATIRIDARDGEFGEFFFAAVGQVWMVPKSPRLARRDAGPRVA